MARTKKKHLDFVPLPLCKGNIQEYYWYYIPEQPFFKNLSWNDFMTVLNDVTNMAAKIINFSHLKPDHDDACATWICQTVLTTYIRGCYFNKTFVTQG